jgi:predicted nucleic acid-binding protein
VYLLDTNIWLERLLNQEKSDQVRQLLERLDSDQLSITDFAFHSIGVVLSRLGRTDAFLSFAQDAFVEGSVSLVRLPPEETESLIYAMGRFNLDFDDAYQYVAAEKHKLILVSFDSDLDRTERGRETPEVVLARLS